MPAPGNRERRLALVFPESGELGRPQLQVQPLRSSGPARCSETLTVLVGTIQKSVYNCVHSADKKPNPSEVRGASLFPRHTHYSPEVHDHPDGPAQHPQPSQGLAVPEHLRCRWSTPCPLPQGAAGGPCLVPSPGSCRWSTPCPLPRELQVVHALSPPGSCRGSTWWPQLSVQLPSPREGHCAL